MRFTETALKGAYIIDLDRYPDQRGAFATTFSAQEFAAHGLESTFSQCNLSSNHLRGTLRGMHYQVAPATQTKLVRCIQGSVWDVIIDLRPDSSTYLHHLGIELSASNRRSLYVPEMFAHGFQSLTDQAEVFYQLSGVYTPNCERGLRYDDPKLQLEWPLPTTIISDRDRLWPLLASPATCGA